jgi:hypothetical protein
MDKHVEDQIRLIEDVKLPALRARLEFKTGGEVNGRLVDTTPEDAERTKERIAEYESILVSLRKGEMP